MNLKKIKKYLLLAWFPYALLTCAGSPSFQFKSADDWKSAVIRQIRQESFRVPPSCSTSTQDNLKSRIAEVQKIPIEIQINEIRSFLQKNDAGSGEADTIIIVHSFVPGYDLENSAGLTLFIQKKDQLSAYTIDTENNNYTFIRKSDPVAALRWFLLLRNDCEFNMFIITFFNKKMHPEQYQVILNADLNQTGF